MIHNFADLDRFLDAKKFREEVRKSHGISKDDLVGVIVALGDWQRKGLDLLIDAVALKRNSKIKIFVAGGGPIEQYKRICKEKSVAENIIFVGFQQTLEQFYGASDFFVFPTVFEAFPLVLLEAAAAGLPILATKIDGTEELVKDGINGFFIERNKEDISAKLDFIYNNRKIIERLGNNVVKLAGIYTRDHMVNQYRTFYNELTHPKN